MLLVLVTLLACAGTGAECEGWDTACDPDIWDDDTDDTYEWEPLPFAIVEDGVYGACDAGVCVYAVTVTGPVARIELDITETGDAALYDEAHDAFELASENADGSLTYRLDLDWVTDLDDVVVNETTLFNPDVADGAVLDRATWYFGASSEDMLDFDCRVTGHDPSHYADWCTNVR